MNRRKFLLGSASFISSLAVCRRGFGQGFPSGSAPNSSRASVPGQLAIALDLAVQTPPRCRRCKVWRLAGPSLDATARVSLAGAEVGPDLTWSPRAAENCDVTDGHFRLDVPCDTAALLLLDA